MELLSATVIHIDFELHVYSEYEPTTKMIITDFMVVYINRWDERFRGVEP